MKFDNRGIIVPKALVDYAVAWSTSPKNQNTDAYKKGFNECLELLRLKKRVYPICKLGRLRTYRTAIC